MMGFAKVVTSAAIRAAVIAFFESPCLSYTIYPPTEVTLLALWLNDKQDCARS